MFVSRLDWGVAALGLPHVDLILELPGLGRSRRRSGGSRHLFRSSLVAGSLPRFAAIYLVSCAVDLRCRVI